MMSGDVERITSIVTESFRRSGQRGVLVGGWGRFAEPDPKNDYVLRIDSAPYEWLFPRISAAVHHAGAGTTAAAARAGIPSVTVPYFADQPFWASRLHRLGVGTRPLPHRALNERNLAEAIRMAVHHAEMRRRAQQLGEAMRKEDGVERAVEIINRALEGARP